MAEHDFEILEVMDGKQRLTTIFDYIDNKFPINDVYFEELCNADQQYLLNHHVEYTRIMRRDSFEELDNATKLQIFLEINSLGTKMFEKDLEHARKVLEN